MKILVDRDLCEANAVCVAIAPELFQIDERDQLNLLLSSPGEELRAKLEEAVRRCPRGALSLDLRTTHE